MCCKAGCACQCLSTLAVGISLVHATPIHIQARNAPKDPLIDCLRQSYPKYPSEGAPTTQQLRACFAQAYPSVKREETQSILDQDLYVEEANPEPSNNTNLIQSRDLKDFPHLDILGRILGVDQEAVCKEEKTGQQTTLHDEFVWAKDVIKEATSLCNEVVGIIEKTGIDQDGGIGIATRIFNNAHDEQSSYLHNNRDLLVRMAVHFYPPVGMALKDIQALAQGVHTLCSAAVKTLMSPRVGCTEEVDWYVTRKFRVEKEMAALGGLIGMYYGGSNNNIASLSLGFSEDSN